MVEYADGVTQVGDLVALTLGIIVLFVGKRLNGSIRLLSDYSIPAPVTGGLIVSVLLGVFYWISGIQVVFAMVVVTSP